MSAYNRGSVVREKEFYPTPKETIEAILQEIDFSKVHRFLEPCAGDMRIYNMVDVPVKDYCEISKGVDYFKTDFSNIGKFDLILTNPPFSKAVDFIEKSLKEAHTVVMLLPVSFLGSRERKDFINKYPITHLRPLSKRPAFVKRCKKKKSDCGHPVSYLIEEEIEICPDCGGKLSPSTDAIEYAWFIWDSRNILKDHQFIKSV